MIDKLIAKVAKLIDAGLLPHPKEGRVAVALSGGADSVALLAALVKLGYDCVALHCNFHLRGEESYRDQRHAEAIACRLGVDIAVESFDVDLRRRATGESVEMACRTLRYEWFRTAMGQMGCAFLAVGHHLEDNVETLMLNLVRGTGLRGAAAMRPRRDNLLRPLIECTRQEILSFLASEGLEYVVDSSNLANDYRRNRLRNIALPVLEEALPGATAGIARSLRCLADDLTLLDDALCAFRLRYVDADGAIHLGRLATEQPHAASILYHLLGGRFNAEETSKILTANSGSRIGTPPEYVVDHGVLRPIAEMSLPGESIVFTARRLSGLPPCFDAGIVGTDQFRADRTGRTLYLDLDKLGADTPLQLRRWRKGDRLKPFGMRGSRLVSDIFADAKLGPEAKASTWLLTLPAIQGDQCQERLLWVAGLRTSRHFPVGADTMRILRIRLL